MNNLYVEGREELPLSIDVCMRIMDQVCFDNIALIRIEIVVFVLTLLLPRTASSFKGWSHVNNVQLLCCRVNNVQLHLLPWCALHAYRLFACRFKNKS
jgi:hypothetical protein